MKTIISVLFTLLLSVPTFAYYKKGDQSTYEKVIYNMHTGRGERFIVTFEVTHYDYKTKSYTIEESELPLANNSSVTKKILTRKSSEIIESKESAFRLNNCPSHMNENIRFDHGYIPTCRGSKNNEFEIFWFANVPFGFAHYEILDLNTHIMTKYMLKNYTKY